MDKYIETLNRNTYGFQQKYSYYSELRDNAKQVYNKCLNYHKVYPYTSTMYGDIGYNPCRPFLSEIRHSEEQVEHYSKLLADCNYKREQCNLIQKDKVGL